jgi:hypothetical protein
LYSIPVVVAGAADRRGRRPQAIVRHVLPPEDRPAHCPGAGSPHCPRPPSLQMRALGLTPRDESSRRHDGLKLTRPQ